MRSTVRQFAWDGAPHPAGRRTDISALNATRVLAATSLPPKRAASFLISGAFVPWRKR